LEVKFEAVISLALGAQTKLSS